MLHAATPSSSLICPINISGRAQVTKLAILQMCYLHGMCHIYHRPKIYVAERVQQTRAAQMPSFYTVEPNIFNILVDKLLDTNFV